MPETKLQEIEPIQEKVDTVPTDKKTTKLSSALRPNEPVLLNEIYTDTLEFNDYNDDYDYWYLNGRKNGEDVSLIYNWDWRNNQDYNFRQGDLIMIQWKMDSIVNPGDEEVVNMKEVAINAKKIASGNKPITFLSRKTAYDEGIKAEVSSMVINQSYLHDITLPEKAALAFVAYDIGNECEGGYDSDGNRRVLWCRIVSALDLGHQCSDKQLNFLRKWFAKDTVALKKLESCPTIPNTATIQTTFDEILIQKNVAEKTITVSYKITGINMRESKSWQWSQTDVFEYDSVHIVLVDSKKSDVSEEDANINPNAVENIDPQTFVLALKDHILDEWKKQDNFDSLKITFTNNVLSIEGNEGFTLSNYDFNEMVINGTDDPQILYLTIGNEGGGAGGNVMLEETYSLTVLDAENFEIASVKSSLLD
ncbi:hypothetical protein LCL86_01165 [Muricauda ruestringensis]|uniref:hypothetical protein n=1 Tax=Flagellimonas ruestringensis TaxID=111501 RepID=UPI001CD67E84|nr:hypothetical protein [Allomuricauda ruestringensis]MCA0957634.1 hypothetical protein [Allomuricauda ruestringensis]